MNKNILELKVDNKYKNFEKYLRPQWSWKTFVSIVLFGSALIFVVLGQMFLVFKKKQFEKVQLSEMNF